MLNIHLNNFRCKLAFNNVLIRIIKDNFGLGASLIEEIRIFFKLVACRCVFIVRLNDVDLGKPCYILSVKRNRHNFTIRSLPIVDINTYFIAKSNL